MASGPSVPNANDVSNAQTQSNIQTATAQTGLNSTNQVTPFGNLSYTQIGKWPDGTPRFQATTTLSPQMQSLFNTGMQTQQQIGGVANNLAGQLGNNLVNPTQPQYQNFANGPNLATSFNSGGQIQSRLGNDDYGAQRDEVENALMGRLNRSYDADRASLEQRLANQGISQGSEAYSNAMRDFNTGLAEARTSAVLGAGQEQNRLQQLALNSGNFANQAQAQQFGQNQSLAGFGNAAQQQMFDNRNQTTGLNNQLQDQRFQNQITGNNAQINQLLALLGGSQINQPSFNQTPQTGIPGTDVSGNAWNQYNAQQNQSNQFYNGLGALGGTIAGALPFFFSDERLKTDISKPVGHTPGGVPIRDWRYKGSPMMMRGYTAQDVIKAGQGHAVRKEPGGFLSVAYREVK